MQGQKTAAKWLAIILLVSISIFSYAMYDSFFVSDGGQVQGADNNNDNNNNNNNLPPDDDALDDLPQITYSEFPRAAVNFDNATVQHTGGTAEEVLLSSHYYQDKTFAILKTRSNSFDFKAENHLAIALFEKDRLVKTVSFSEKDEVFLDSNINKNGIHIVSKTISNECKLRLFSFNAEEVQNITLNLSNETILGAKFSSEDNIMNILIATNSSLYLKSLNSVFAISDFCPPYSSANASIVEIIKYKQSFVIALNTQSTSEILMASSSGFEVVKTISGGNALSLNVFSENNFPCYFVTQKTVAGITVKKLDFAFLNAGQFEIANATSAIVSKNGSYYIIAANSKLYFLCSHLDSLFLELDYSALNINSVDSVKSVLCYGLKQYLLLYSSELHKATLVVLDGVTAVSSYSFGAEETLFSFAVTPDTIKFVFTTALKSGYFFENFGGKDVYYIAIGTK